MIIIKRLLVPIDFGRTSDAALNYGVELARLFGARLHLLHVFDASMGIREYPVPPPAPPENDARSNPRGS